MHANIKHLMSAFFRDADERKRRDARLSHCHHTIKQSSAPPNSLQLGSAGTRHSHYNKHSLLMLRLHRHTMHTDAAGWRGEKKEKKRRRTILRLIDRPDSWKIIVRMRQKKRKKTHTTKTTMTTTWTRLTISGSHWRLGRGRALAPVIGRARLRAPQ